MGHEDEKPQFWQGFSLEDLANRTAQLHAQRRELEARVAEERVLGARYAVSVQFVAGTGIEVGAGDRPVPVREGVRVRYGDLRNGIELDKYFSRDIDFKNASMHRPSRAYLQAFRIWLYPPSNGSDRIDLASHSRTPYRRPLYARRSRSTLYI